MSARDKILGKLRAAQARPLPNPDDAVVAHYASLPRTAQDQLAQEFAEKITAWHAEVHTVPRGQWVDKLKDIVAEKGIRTLLYPPAKAHGKALEASGVAGLKPYDRPIDEWKQELFEGVDAAITGTRGAIAETGTLIVWPDADEPRLMSLVPPIHIALVDADTIVPTLYDAITAQGWSQGLPTNALLITGPSKTADIQQTLAYGAHGPKELIVLLLTGEASQ
ncbi:MAG: lactate utilization protein [Rhodocyclales bacterium]|nr:lactate utilization protein [Rhodocyclales bacterium]